MKSKPAPIKPTAPKAPDSAKLAEAVELLREIRDALVDLHNLVLELDARRSNRV